MFYVTEHIGPRASRSRSQKTRYAEACLLLGEAGSDRSALMLIKRLFRILCCVGLSWLLTSVSAFAEVISFDQALPVGADQLSTFADGETWEFGNDSISTAGFTLAAGDTLRIDATLNSSLLLTDLTGTDELFRAFVLRFPDNGLDVSSVQLAATVSFYAPDGAVLATFASGETQVLDSWPYAHCADPCGKRGLQTIFSGDLVAAGNTFEIASWSFLMTVLADPQGLLLGSQFHTSSFGFHADAIDIGSDLPTTVPEPSTLALLLVAGALAGPVLSMRRRHRGPTAFMIAISGAAQVPPVHDGSPVRSSNWLMASPSSGLESE